MQLKVFDIGEKKEEIEISESLSSRRDDELKIQGEEGSLTPNQKEEFHQKESISQEEEDTGENTAQNLPLSKRSKKKKKTLKKSLFGSPRLLESKPHLTKPTFKALMGGDHEAFEDILLEVAVDNQLPEENDSSKQIASTERVHWLREETKREVALPEDRPPDDSEDVRVQIKKSASVYLKSNDKIDLTFGEYLRSFVSQTETIKEKMYILNEGIRRINERLDIFNLLKKLRELDKLKILLLEEDQYILFEGLPKPEIMRETSEPQRGIKNAKFIQEKVKNDLIFASYQNLKSKSEENIIDKKLLTIFDDIFIE